MCVNLPDVNRRTRSPIHPLQNTQDVMDVIGDATYVSALDVKAGFLNVPIEESSKQFCGIITQDGVYIGDRMLFGFLGAPATF